MTDDEKAVKNRTLAEALGWRVEKIADTPASWGNCYAIWEPDGTPVLMESAYGSENHWPEYAVSEAIPDFYDSLDAVVDALNPDLMALELSHFWNGKFDAVIRDYTPVDHVNSHVYEGVGATRQEAAAEALLAWARANKGETP